VVGGQRRPNPEKGRSRNQRTERTGLSAKDRQNARVPSPAIENLVAQLTRLPSIGQRTARRLAFHLLQVPKEEATALAEAIIDVK